MAQLPSPVEPFGEVNVYPQPDGSFRIVATILMEPDIEGARAGLALDGSASMQKMYGARAPISPLFKAAGGGVNYVEPVARKMAAYLAKFASDGQAHLAYWACSPDGSKVEPIGAVTEAGAAALRVTGPRLWGRQTQLLPPIRHFVEGVFAGAAWAIAVFVTDGVIEDLAAVKEYCRAFAGRIARGEQGFVKFVLLGFGEEVDEAQMEELDDMFEGEELLDPNGDPIDLWDHKIASEMKSFSEIFAEVVSDNAVVAESGTVFDGAGRVAHAYPTGLPARLRFTLPAGTTAFTLDFPGARVTQDITDALRR